MTTANPSHRAELYGFESSHRHHLVGLPLPPTLCSGYQYSSVSEAQAGTCPGSPSGSPGIGHPRSTTSHSAFATGLQPDSASPGAHGVSAWGRLCCHHAAAHSAILVRGPSSKATVFPRTRQVSRQRGRRLACRTRKKSRPREQRTVLSHHNEHLGASPHAAWDLSLRLHSDEGGPEGSAMTTWEPPVPPPGTWVFTREPVRERGYIGFEGCEVRGQG